MILLPSNHTDFKLLANQAVDEHIGTGKSIEDCVVEAAKKRELTIDEIKRLVEKTNTELSLRHLKGDNKKENFELAKFEDVVRRTHGEADEGEADDKAEAGSGESSDGVEKTASRPWRSGPSVIPTTRRPRRTPNPFGDLTKTASRGEADSPREVNSAELYALRDSYEKAKLEKAATEFRINDNLSWLVENARKAKYAELVKFASNTLAAHRDGTVIRHIGDAIGKGDLAKYATEIPTFADDTDEAVRRVDMVYADMAKFRKQAETVSQYELVFSKTREALRRLRTC